MKLTIPQMQAIIDLKRKHTTHERTRIRALLSVVRQRRLVRMLRIDRRTNNER